LSGKKPEKTGTGGKRSYDQRGGNFKWKKKKGRDGKKRTCQQNGTELITNRGITVPVGKINNSVWMYQ